MKSFLASVGLWERTPGALRTLTCISREFYFGPEPALSGIHSSLAGPPGRAEEQSSSALGLRWEDMIPKWTGMAGPAGFQKDMGAGDSRLNLACKDPRPAGAV